MLILGQDAVEERKLSLARDGGDAEFSILVGTGGLRTDTQQPLQPGFHL